MTDTTIDFSSRYMIAYSLLALIVVVAAALSIRYLRWRRAEHRRRYGIGRRPERRR